MVGDLEILNPDRFPWSTEIAARFVLGAAAYRPGRDAARVGCPVLVVVCDDDVVAPPAPAVRAALRAPRGELLRLPGGHYAVYGGNGFECAVEAELAFLERHLSGLDDQSALQAAHTPRRAEVSA